MRGRIVPSVLLALAVAAWSGTACQEREQGGKAEASKQAGAEPAGKAQAPLAPPDVAAPPPDAQTTASGLSFKVLATGTGSVHPGTTDLVTVHYTGWTTDGKLLDSSVQRGKPVTFPLKRFIPGWIEGVKLMVAGEKRRFWIPEKLAFQGNPTAPKGMVVYDIELLHAEPDPEAAPPDVAAPPEDAGRTLTGLVTKVLRAGTGKRHPRPTSYVTVQYTGWTTDGKMFDSSVVRGTAASFRLDKVIPGWTEGLQLMVEGEKRRLWIPEKLAYKGQPGKPQGMLVFDVELLTTQD